MSVENWVWLPHPAHFIGSDSCRSFMATVVGDGLWIVSTVGDYFPPGAKKRVTIGSGERSYFETLVFPAKKAPAKGACCPYVPARSMELDGKRYRNAYEARRGHMELCHHWDARETANVT